MKKNIDFRALYNLKRMFERPIKKYFVRQNNGRFKQPTKGNIWPLDELYK